MHDRMEEHLQADQGVLQYFKATLRNPESNELTREVYTDADYAKSTVDGRSTIGY